MKLLDQIKMDSKTKPTYVFFDMDGVLVDYQIDYKGERFIEGNKYYLSKAPLNSAIRFAEMLSKIDNVNVGILSNCIYDSQVQDKKIWLKQYLPFLNEENINILSYQTFKAENSQDRQQLKTKYINNKYKNQDVNLYLVDDDHGIFRSFIKDENNKVKVFHISSIYVE